MTLSERWIAFFNKTVPNLLLRTFLMCFGISLNALSIAMARAAGLGTSPISSFPNVLSHIFPVTIGTFLLAMNTLFVIIQIILLRRDFKLVLLLQLPFVVFFAALTDFYVPFCEMLPLISTNYLASALYTVLSVVIVGIGVFVQVQCRLVVLPGEGLCIAISKVFGWEFSKVKIAVDSGMGILGAVSSLIAFQALIGVREGTVLSALGVGFVVGKLKKWFPNFQRYIPVEGQITFTASGV